MLRANHPVHYPTSTFNANEPTGRSSVPSFRSKELDKILQKYEDSASKPNLPRPYTTSVPQVGDYSESKRIIPQNMSQRQSFNERETEKTQQPSREVFYSNVKNPRASEILESGTSFGHFQQQQSNNVLQNERTSLNIKGTEPTYNSDNIEPATDLHSQYRAVNTETETRPLSQEKKHFLEDTTRKDISNVPYTSNLATDQTRQAYSTGGSRRNMEPVLDHTPKRIVMPEVSRISSHDPTTLSLIPSLLESTGHRARDERRSSAFKDAMKALQDRTRELENENEVLRRKLSENQVRQVQALEEMERRFRAETDLLKEKEKEIKDDILKMQETNTVLRDELEKEKSLNAKHVDELTHTQFLLSKARDDHQAALTAAAMLKKQIQILEQEKNRHLEENANEKNEFEKQFDDFMERLRLAEDNNHKIGMELKIAVEAKNEAEGQLNKVRREIY